MLARHAQQARTQRRHEDGDLHVADPVGRPGVNPELLAGEAHRLPAEEGSDDLDVLIGVPPRGCVRQPEHPLDDRLVRRADAEREPSGHADCRRDGGRPAGLQDGVAGIGLQHRRAQLDRGSGPTGERHRHHRVTGGGARVPQAGEAVRFGTLGLLDDVVDAPAESWQPDAHLRPSRPVPGL